MPLTKVSFSVIQVANNVTSTTVGNTTSIPSFTFDQNGVITSASNTAISGAGITANTIANSAFQTGSIENYSRATGLFSGMRNRIINGAMVIAQRGTGNTSTAFLNQVDQFQVATNSAATYTFGQNSTAPTGFIKSALNTNTSAATLTGTDYYSIRNVIEGLNIADLGWGAANAKTVTLSFWVRSSLTGTFGGSIFNGSANYSYPFTYSIASANTFEYKTITIAGPTAGTWATDNGTGMFIEWSLGCGSTYLGTAGAWAASRFQGATGQVQLSQTSGATFYITGVQLEVGSTSTSFDYRPYGTELQLCQRYFRFWQFAFGWESQTATSQNATAYQFPQPLRALPTLVRLGSAISGRESGTSVAAYEYGPTSGSASGPEQYIFGQNSVGGTTPVMIGGYGTASAEL
jgi:hypothetical protein